MIEHDVAGARRVRWWRAWVALLVPPAALALAFGAVAALAHLTMGLDGDALVAHVTAVAPVPTTFGFLAVLAVTWRLAKADGRSFAALGWTAPPGRDVALGVVVAAALGGLHVGWVYPVLVKLAPTFDPAVRAQALGPLLVMLGVAVVAEDTLYRGYALEALSARHGRVLAAVLTSAAYALLLPQPGWVLKAWALGLGVALAALRLASKTLWPVVVAHAAVALGPRVVGG